MKRKKIVKEMGYVCTPSNFSIKLKHQMVSHNNRTGLGINMTIFDGSKSIFSSGFLPEKPITSRFDYDNLLKDILQQLFGLTRNKFIKVILKDDFYGIQFYDKFKQVQSKLGTVIYKRKAADRKPKISLEKRN